MVHAQHGKSIFVRLVIVFFLVLLPLIGTQIAMYRWGRAAVTNELNAAAEANVFYLRDHLVDNIMNVYRQIEHLMSNQHINEFMIQHTLLAPDAYFMKIREILSILRLVRNSNPFVEEVVLYYPATSMKISSKQLFSTLEDQHMQKRFQVLQAQNMIVAQIDGILTIGIHTK